MLALSTVNTDLIHLLNDTGVSAIFVDPKLRITQFTTHASALPSLIWCEVARPLGHVFANLFGADRLVIATECALDWSAQQDIVLQDPTGIWLEARIRPFHHQNGTLAGAAITLVDISPLKRLEQALRHSDERYRAMVEWSLEAVNILRNGRFIFVNAAALRLYGAHSASDLLGQPSQERIHPEDIPRAQLRMAQLLERHVNAPMAEMRFLKLDGSVMHVQTQATLIDYEGEPAIHVAWRDITPLKQLESVQRDIHQRQQVADEVLHLAFHDMLTQLPNRRALIERVNQTRLASKRSGCHAALILLDLDNFKPLNDTHGHAAGDVLLVEVAARLQRCVRESDTVVRYGGDEFVVLLSTLSDDPLASAEQAAIVARKMAHTLMQPYQLTLTGAHEQSLIQVEHVCTASIGVALFLHDDAQYDDILKWADAAMYKAKKSGKNRIQFHETPQIAHLSIVSALEGYKENKPPALIRQGE